MNSATIRLYGRETASLHVGTAHVQSQLFTRATSIFINLSGSISFYSNGCAFHLEPGDAILIPKLSFVLTDAKPGASQSFRYMVICLDDELVYEYNKFLASKQYMTFYISNALTIRDDTLRQVLGSFVPYLNQQALHVDKLLEIKLLELLFVLDKITKGAVFDRVHHKPIATHRLITTIAANLYRPDFSLVCLSRESGMSISTIKRKFKAAFSKPITEWATARRMEKANFLLANSSKTIKEIAYECGFTTPAYFNRLYKKNHGITPRSVRERRIANPLADLAQSSPHALLNETPAVNVV